MYGGEVRISKGLILFVRMFFEMRSNQLLGLVDIALQAFVAGEIVNEKISSLIGYQ